MRLLLDVGNTRLKWGLHDDTGWVAQGAFTHKEAWNFVRTLPPQARVDDVCGVNVAGEAAAIHVGRALAPLKLATRWLRPCADCCGVHSRYDITQLGADRWAALIGARHVHEGACLVVTAGTATTIDVLDHEGVFHGGVIAPGVDLMKQALAGNTAQLNLAVGHHVDLPTHTADAIHMGCLQAQAGAIERMFRHVAELPAACCLLGGGAAPLIAPLLGIPLRRIDNLVLEGVAIAQAEDGRNEPTPKREKG